MSKKNETVAEKPKFLLFGELSKLPPGIRHIVRISRWGDRHVERLGDWLGDIIARKLTAKKEHTVKKFLKELAVVLLAIGLLLVLAPLADVNLGEILGETAGDIGAGFSNAGEAAGGFSPSSGLLIFGGVLILFVGWLIAVATPARRRAKAAEAAEAEKTDEIGK